VKRRGLVFILDGLGDRPCALLGGQTPLQAAPTPTLDRLARRGVTGLMDPLSPGATVDTHTGVGILFGLSAEDGAHLRRGPVEAAGAGVDAQPGDIFLRANFATVEAGADAPKRRILDRRAGRIRAGVDELCAALRGLEVGDGGAGRIVADLFPATQHRAVARLRGVGCALSAQVTDTDPGGEAIARGVLAAGARQPSIEAAAVAAASARACADAPARTARAINRFTARAHAILDAHPVNATRAAAGLPVANAVILRSAGRHVALRSRLTARGLRVAVVAGETTVLGLGKLLDFTTVTDARFTSLPDTDIAAKLRAGAAALAAHDLVFVHLKGSDTAAHDRDPRLKSAFIARFDRALAALDGGRLDRGDGDRGDGDRGDGDRGDGDPGDGDRGDGDPGDGDRGDGDPGGRRLSLREMVIGVCADHATDSNTGAHNADPVPALLATPGDGGAGGAYNETACARGALGRLTAAAYIDHVIEALDAK